MVARLHSLGFMIWRRQQGGLHQGRAGNFLELDDAVQEAILSANAGLVGVLYCDEQE